MATNVGSVEIDVDVDTRDLSDEIERSANAAARSYGDRFSQELGKELSSKMTPVSRKLRLKFADEGTLAGKDLSDNLKKSLNRGIEKWDLDITEGINWGQWGRAVKQFDDLDDAVRQITARLRNLQQTNRDSFSTHSMNLAIASLNDYADAAKAGVAESERLKKVQAEQAQFLDDMAAAAKDAEKAQRDYDKVLSSQNTDASTLATHRYSDALADLNVQLRKTSTELGRARKAQEAGARVPGLEDTIDQYERLQAAVTKFTRTSRDDLVGLSKDSRDYSERVNEQTLTLQALVRQNNDLTKSTERVATSYKKESDGQNFLLRGAKSLKNSRNDFIHLIGGLTEQLVKLPGRFYKAGEAVGDFAGKIAKMLLPNMDQLAQSFPKLAQMVSKFGGKFAGKGGLVGGIVAGVAAIAALVYAVAGIANVITSLAGGISALTGIVVALAGAIGIGLAGALLAVLPMLGALVVGVGAVVIAFTGATKEINKATKPLQTWFKELRKAVTGELMDTLAQDSERLAGVLEQRVTPLLKESAGAVGDFISEFTETMDSGAMKSNLKVFETTWPDILRNLGTVFNNVFSGISGILAAISPQVEDITDGWANATEGFSEWANSVEGQKDITEFFDGAIDTFDTLWQIVKNVGSALGSLFDQGKGEGDSMLESIENITGEFAKWVDSEEGREAISTWFEDARALATDVWDALTVIGEAFDDWDTSDAREDFGDVVGTVADLTDKVMGLIGWFADLWESITPGEENPFGDWWDRVVVGWWNDTVVPWFQGLAGDVGGWFSDMWSGLGTAASNAWTSVQTWWTGTVIPWFTGLPAAVGGWFTDLWNGLGTAASNAWTGVQTWWTDTVVPWFQGLPGKMSETWHQFWYDLGYNAVVAWQTVTAWWSDTAVPWFQALPGKVGKWFTQMWDELSTGIGAGWADVTGWWSGTAVPWFQALPGKVGAWFTNMWDEFSTGIGAGWAKVTGWWSKTAVPWLQGLPDRVASAITGMWDALVEEIQDIDDRIIGWWNNTAWPNIRGAFENIDLAQVGRDIVNGLVSGMNDVPVIGAITGIVDDIMAGARDAAQTKSPSKITRQIGRDISAGLAVGQLDGQEDVLKATEKVIDGLIDLQEDLIDKESKRIIEARKKQNDAIRAYNNTHKKDRNLLPTISSTEADKIAKKNTAAVRKAINDVAVAEVKAQRKRKKSVNDVLAAAAQESGRTLDNWVNNEKVTLRDLGAAWDVLTNRLEAATAKLKERKEELNAFAASVKSAAQTFASALNAEPVAQHVALTSDDITKSMAKSLEELRTFRDNVKKLTEQGLNETTLRQIVEGGVEGGGAVAAALVAGGQAAVDEVDVLQGQINSAAKSLGDSTADTFYGAGVDAAQGIVDGIKSQRSAIREAMEDIAEEMVTAIKKKLKIKSPSRVFDQEVGQQIGLGVKQGVEAQEKGVRAAISRLAGLGVRATAGMLGGGVSLPVGDPAGSRAVSAQRVVQVAAGAIQVITPTRNPELVASSVLDRLVARI